MSKRILIRADDLGYSEAVNYGIAKSVRDGIIRSVGVMPNMPAAKHGLSLLEGVPVCFGQHTNICVGRPLTDPARIPSLCQESGEFKPSSAYREAAKKGEDFVVLEEAVLEVEAQYHRFVELTGGQPGYFECHAVSSAHFFQALETVAKRYGLLYLKMSFSGPALFRHTKLYASMESMLPDYDPVKSLKDAAQRDYGPDGCCMFVCHPGYLDDYILRTSSLTIPRTKEVAMAIDPQVKAWLAENDVELVTYDDLT